MGFLKRMDGRPAASYVYIGDVGAGLGGMNICANAFRQTTAPSFYVLPIRSPIVLPIGSERTGN